MSSGVLIFVEGDTEVEFYKKLLTQIRSKCSGGKFPANKVIVENLKGIGNYKKRVFRVFTKRVIPEYKDVQFTVVVCYDTDVFELSENPPVNFKEVKKILLEIGAVKVVEVKARKSIEDWFLKDIKGVLRCLKLNENTTAVGNDGHQKIKWLYKKANKLYIKGSKASGLVDALDMNVIMAQICDDLKPLCKALGASCDNNKCKIT